MPTAAEIAIAVLPHFAESVLAGQVRSYGHYANLIGRNPARDSMAIGKAMHTIGGICVLATIPVAPLHFVKRQDGEWRGVFESDAREKIHVLPHYDLLYVTARGYKYTERDFAHLAKILGDTLPNMLPDLSPHDIWHLAMDAKDKGSTLLERAVKKYEVIFADLKRLRRRK